MESIRPIRTEADYEAALARIDTLLQSEEGSSSDDELQVWSTLIEAYEDEHYPIDFPNPVAAIKFRMEQSGLTRKDLIPLLGSQSRVTEVLGGKRPLTLAMIRALNRHLGIPAEVLIQESGGSIPEAMDDIEWERFPLKELVTRGWARVSKGVSDLKGHAEEIVRPLFERAGGFDCVPLALCRKNDSSYRNAKTNEHSLRAWCLHVIATARETQPPKKYRQGRVDFEFLREVASMSARADGIREAKAFLADHGIALVAARHLPKTYLDGVAMMTGDGLPIVGLTLRHDRIDNFWFCLLHELAHIGRHIDGQGIDVFIDDLDLPLGDGHDDRLEREANEWAQNALIPPEHWAARSIMDNPTSFAVAQLAAELGRSPAVIAGRVRYELEDFKMLAGLVGTGEVRINFPEWK